MSDMRRAVDVRTRLSEWRPSRLQQISIIVAGGVVVRLLLLLIVNPQQNFFGGDSASYLAGAQEVLSGHLPDAFRPPLYPYFLALTLPLGWWAPLAAQCVVTIAAGMAAALRGRFLAGLLIATCPFLALSDFKILSEPLYTDLVFLAWTLDRAVVSGLLIGAATLARNTLLLLPAFSWAVLRTRRVGITTAIAFAVVAPWLFAAGGAGGGLGLNLWIGTWERNGDWYLAGLNHPAFPPYAFASKVEEETVRTHWMDDRVLERVAIDRIEHHPLSVARAWVLRYPRLWIGTRADAVAWRLPRGSALWTVFKAGFFALNLAILAFGLWGALKPDRFLIPVLYTAAIYVPFHNCETRYSLIAIPFLLWLGARRLGLMTGEGAVAEPAPQRDIAKRATAPPIGA